MTGAPLGPHHVNIKAHAPLGLLPANDWAVGQGGGMAMPLDWGLLLVHFATRMLLQVLALL